jgi:hypothetical protein
MGEVLPFPLKCRRALILRQARWYASQRPQSAEANLQRQLEGQREALLRRSIHADIADRNCRELEAAIRAEVGTDWGASNG